MFFVSIFTLWK